MTWYFKKELADSPIFIEGHAYRFDIMATDDGVLANHLLNAAAKRVGGIISIDQPEYDEELKKKAQLQPSSVARKGREEVRQKFSTNLLRKRKGAEPVVGAVGNQSQLSPEQQAAVPQSIEAFIPKAQRGILA